MRFYNREKEIDILNKNRERSKNNSVFTVITGRRRIGKTSLIKESEKNEKVLYFFVQRVNETILCEQLAADAKASLGTSLYNTGNFCDLFEQLMRYGENENFTFVIDEFQELERINAAIMSGIQKHWDGYEKRTKVNLIVCGSVQSMMKKIFEKNNEPLFGRASSKFNIGPFRPDIIKTILKEHNPDFTNDDLLFLYTVTGGVPKYVTLLMDDGAVSMKKMIDHICSPNSLFLTDGKDLLISEFGKDYMTYFSILQLIANGKNTQRDINASIGKDCGAYLDKLEKEYGIVRKSRPMFSKENSRDVRWQISDNYLRFYFRFISTNMSAIEYENYDVLKSSVLAGYEDHSGTVLEDYFRNRIAEEERFTDIGSYWDRKGENEIDMIVLNDLDKKAIVAEVKRNPKKASVGRLADKAGTVHGLKGYDIEYRILSLKDM